MNGVLVMGGMLRGPVVCLGLLVTLGFPPTSVAVDFAPPVSYPVGTTPVAIVAGDFNGDNKPDLATANAGSNDVSVLINNGAGTFKPAVNSAAGTSPQAMAAADFNSDGKLDLVVINPGVPSNATGGALFLLLGNGDGTFQAPAQIPADQFPLSVAVADLNGDGHPDLILGDGASGALTILLGKGDGTFPQHSTVSLASSGAVGALTAGDFNGDKKLDIVAAISAGQVLMLLGNGDGSFHAPAQITASANSPHLLAADFNRDGKLDVILRAQSPRPPRCRPPLGCLATDRVVMLSGKGDGTFNPPTSVLTSLSNSLGNIATGDLNADSKSDLIVPRAGLGLSYLGHGDGTFLATAPVWTGLGGFVTAADLNADKLPDLAVIGSANDVDVFLNTSSTSGADLAVTEPAQANVTIGGDDLTYRATVLNTGPQDAAGVTLKETLPAGFTLVSAAASQGTCSGTATITCYLGAMVDVSSATVDFTVKPTVPGTSSDSVQVSATQPDLNSKNNSASIAVNAVLPADLAVSGTASETIAKIGDNVTFTITVTNHGPATATNVSLTDGLSDSLAITSLTVSQGSCAPPIVCAIGTLAPGASATLKFVATMSAAEILTNGVSTSSDQPDLVADNNTISMTITVNPADLVVTQTASATSVAPGGQSTITLQLTNKGPSAASNVMLTDSQLGGGTPSPATTSQGSCSAPSGGQITCSIGSLAASATATVTIPITFTDVGLFTNEAVVSATEPDPDGTNDSASTNIAVNAAPDFMVSATSSSLKLRRGASGTDVLTVTSIGGFSADVSLACSVSGPAPVPSCSLSPASVTPGSTPATSTLTLTTVSAALSPSYRNELKGLFYAAWLALPGIALIGAGFKPGRSRRRGHRAGLLCSLITIFAVIALLPACGGGSGNSGNTQTAATNYTVTVTSTSGAISKSTPIMVTVN